MLAAAGCDTEPEAPANKALDLEAIELVAPGGDQLDGALFSLWSSRESDGEVLWAAGGTSTRSVVHAWDGTSWTTHDPGLGRRLWWVHGFAGGPIFVVGEGGVIARHDPGTGDWTPMESGVPGTTLFGVWGASPDDLWAVGGPSQVAPPGVTKEGDVILHYDGTAWTRVRLPLLDEKDESAQKFLFKVWGTASDQVVIVGSSGLALHYDGSTWRQEPTGDTSAPLFTVIGRAADDIYAVGGQLESRLVHWDGAAWSHIPPGPFAPPVTQGLWTAPGHRVYITGYDGYVARLEPDGTWAEPLPITNAGFHAIWANHDNELWVAGGDIAFGDPSVGALGTTASAVPAP